MKSASSDSITRLSLPTGLIDGCPLLAISGGLDSVVLAHVLYTQGIPFAMAHCNFHLRPGDCDRDERFVSSLAEQYEVPIHIAQFDTIEYASQHHFGIEDAARRLRYDFFEKIRQQYGYSVILTAHHRDDSIETFFLNLLRGTGLTGLHGILPIQGNIRRPLLSYSRSDLESYASEHHLMHVEDVTNASLDYRRNRIRHQLMPVVRDINPSSEKNIQQTIQHLQSVDSLYQALLEPIRKQLVVAREDGSVCISLRLPFPQLHHQLLFELIRPFGFNAFQVENILASPRPGRQFYSATHHAIQDRESILIFPNNPSPDGIGETKSFTVEMIENCDFSDLDLKRLPSNVALFDADAVSLPFCLRGWHEGDRFKPLGMAHGTQLVSDFFSDHKFSLHDKSNHLILVDAEGTIHWIVSCRTSHISRITPSTKQIVKVVVKDIL